MKRREFLAAAAAAPLILPNTVFGANKKLNVGFIGMGAVMTGSLKRMLQQKHNIVAFCDVDSNQIRSTKKRHKQAVPMPKSTGTTGRCWTRRSLWMRLSLQPLTIGMPRSPRRRFAPACMYSVRNH